MDAGAGFGGVIVEQADDAVALLGHAGDFAEDGGGGVSGADDEEADDAAGGNGAGFLVEQAGGDADAAQEHDGKEPVEDEEGFGEAGGHRFQVSRNRDELPAVVACDDEGEGKSSGDEQPHGIAEGGVTPGDGAAMKAHRQPHAELDGEYQRQDGQEVGGEPGGAGGGKIKADGECQPEGGA